MSTLQVTKELVLKDFNLQDQDVINIYPYGSRVYLTHSYQSDHDFIVIVKGTGQDRDSLSSSYNNLNATIYSEESFREKIDRHSISAMECVCLPDANLLKRTKAFPFKIDLSVLRESISAKASHAFHKAYKKFVVPQDRNVYIAKKSLFHGIRIANFGIQMAEHGRIINYDACNSIWFEILNNPDEDWESYDRLYTKLFNNTMTSFRKLAPMKRK